MLELDAYNDAKRLVDYLAGSPKRLRITMLSSEVGFRLDIGDPNYQRNTWERQDVCLARDAFAQVVDKLGPAVTSLFERYLAELVEERRQKAITAAKDRRHRENRKWLHEVARLQGVEIGSEEGATCNRDECNGVLELAPVENCTCATAPPCINCAERAVACPKCGWTSDDE